jgi:aminoglycoside 3-N-acetyltransferase I
VRLTAADRDEAKALFAMMADVFHEERQELSDEYVDSLLRRREFWAVAATVDREIVGGLTAHTLPLTRAASSEIFIYDIAVRQDHQRRGIGRQLMHTLRTEAAAAGILTAFVPAEDDDVHALDFYRALGGTAAAVTLFTFTHPGI